MRYPTEHETSGEVEGISDEFGGNKAVNETRRGILHCRRGVKMSSIADR